MPRRKPGSESAGYHYDATPKGPPRRPKTPIVAPKPSEAARGPAGDYAGAAKEYARAVQALPPAAQKVTEQATRRARRTARASQTRERRRTRAITQTRQRTAKRKRQSAETEKRVQQTEKAVKAKRYEPNPAKAIVSSKPNPAAKPPTFKGKPTAGTPTRQELRRAANAGTLKVNKAGFATTPKVRKVGGELRRLQAEARSSSAPLPSLGPEESRNAHTVLRRGEKKRATRKEKLAAVTTGLVEAPDFKNPAGGHADSEGWRQERTSIYGTGPQGPRNVKASADRFFDEVRADAGTDTAPTPGLLAQAAQGSAFPERYDEELPQAKAILKAHNQGSLKPAQRRKLAATKAKAEKLGLRVAQPKGALGPPPKKVVTRFKAAQVAAKELEKAKLPYVWGGGHGDPASRPTGGGLDCSGAVSYVLNKIGAMKGALVSGDMGSVLKPGPGAVTVFYNDGHTFMRIGNKYFGTSNSNPAGGAGFIDPPSQSYLSEYSVGHVPELGKKQALQLDISLPSGGQSFPGMTLSSSGTTATIQSGASTTQSKPGFSKKPIRLTPGQKYRRTTRKLREAGIGGEIKEPEVSESIKDLERRYGVKVAA